MLLSHSNISPCLSLDEHNKEENMITSVEKEMVCKTTSIYEIKNSLEGLEVGDLRKAWGMKGKEEEWSNFILNNIYKLKMDC